MFTRKGFAFALIPMCVLTIIGLAGTTALAGNGGPPPIREIGCQTPFDTAIIATVSSTLGEVVAVPIYVGSDNEIQAFQFKFTLSAALNFDSVTVGSWGNDIAAPDTQGGYLIIGQPNASTPVQPTTDEPFITLWYNTHCQTTYSTTVHINWGPSDDPDDPSVYFAEYGGEGCLRDPIEVKGNGGIAIAPIAITFSISTDTALIGDVVTVTVSCENDYEFAGFQNYLAIDEDVLTYATPFFTTASRVGDSAYAQWFGPQAIIITGHNTQGFGTTASDGANLYQLHLTVISDVDDVSGAVSFVYDPAVWALDCNQRLDTLSPPAVSGEDGAVVVPPYRAEFEFGDVVWNNQSTCEFKVPVLMKNNFTVDAFRLSIGYSDDVDLPMGFVDFESADPLYWPMTSSDQLCGDDRYALVGTYGYYPIDTSSAFREIGWLIFENDDADTADVTYTVSLLEYGCSPYDPTWVNTIGYLDTLSFFTSDPQVSGTSGEVDITDPYTVISVPGCMSDYCKFPPDCEWWAYSGVFVNTNQDVDSVVGHLTWSPSNTFCMTLQNVDYGHLGYSGSATTSYTFYITDVSAGPYAQKFADLKVTNGTHNDVYGNFYMSDARAVDACTHDSIGATGSGGGIFTYKLPVAYVSCFPNGNGQKVASVPRSYALGQNYPNPFNAGTLIDFSLSDESHVRIEVFNVLGQRVRTLIDDMLPAGQHTIAWNGTNANGQAVATGVYLYRMRADSFESTKKMLLLK